MKTKKLHLGCGSKYIPGFLHCDLANYEHIDYKQDMRDLSIFEDNSIDLIYCCHALEYFDRHQVVLVLKEWFRVLKKGGILRLAVPDFEAIVKVYLKYQDLDHQGILGPLYGKWQNSNSEENLYHKTTWDLKSLTKVLKDLGFSDVQRYNIEDTIHKDYDDYSAAYVPHMDKENGILISLNIEAVK
ncbi:MAG: methyltransferase [Epsilonproteobacteria bacterium]|nr:MAG: methyltransferase [Campylobacterota bacterium]